MAEANDAPLPPLPSLEQAQVIYICFSNSEGNL